MTMPLRASHSHIQKEHNHSRVEGSWASPSPDMQLERRARPLVFVTLVVEIVLNLVTYITKFSMDCTSQHSHPMVCEAI